MKIQRNTVVNTGDIPDRKTCLSKPLETAVLTKYLKNSQQTLNKNSTQIEIFEKNCKIYEN